MKPFVLWEGVSLASEFGLLFVGRVRFEVSGESGWVGLWIKLILGHFCGQRGTVSVFP